jgi:hypothetical protein
MAPPGTARLRVNGTEAGSGRMEHTVPILFTAYAGMDIGRDNGEVVDVAYQDKAPFAFNTIIKKVVFDIRHPNDPGAHAALHQAHHAGTQARHAESWELGDRPGSNRLQTATAHASWHACGPTSGHQP